MRLTAQLILSIVRNVIEEKDSSEAKDITAPGRI